MSTASMGKFDKKVNKYATYACQDFGVISVVHALVGSHSMRYLLFASMLWSLMQGMVGLGVGRTERCGECGRVEDEQA